MSQDDPYELSDGYEDEPKHAAKKRSSRVPWLLFVLALAAGGGGAYHLWTLLQRARADAGRQAATATAEKVELTQRVEKMEAEKADLLALKNELSLQVQSKDEELKKLQGTYLELEAKMKDEIAKGDVRLSQSGGRIKVDLVDKILFDTGDASIGTRGAEVLSRMGAVLANVQDKKIQVSGHTDDRAISERLRGAYPTNWELASARAVNVVRFLEEKANVPGRRLVAAAYGPWEPISSNASATGRSRNRRIEIVLTPALAPAARQQGADAGAAGVKTASAEPDQPSPAARAAPAPEQKPKAAVKKKHRR